MTASQIAIEIALGLALLLVGVFLREPLERFHEYLKRPSPLTPKTRGQWTEYLAMMQQSLERINYLNTHPRDLYIHLFQLLFAGMAFDGIAFIIFVWVYGNPASPQREFWLSLSIVLLVLGIALATLGVFEGDRLSQKRIDKTRAKIKKQIDQYKKLLAEPPSED
jgi:ABC-type Na+ efflux pump permease subunit